jgi:hypothetical protein
MNDSIATTGRDHFSVLHFSVGKTQTEKCKTEKFRAPGAWAISEVLL